MLDISITILLIFETFFSSAKCFFLVSKRIFFIDFCLHWLLKMILDELWNEYKKILKTHLWSITKNVRPFDMHNIIMIVITTNIADCWLDTIYICLLSFCLYFGIFLFQCKRVFMLPIFEIWCGASQKNISLARVDWFFYRALNFW